MIEQLDLLPKTMTNKGYAIISPNLVHFWLVVPCVMRCTNELFRLL